MSSSPDGGEVNGEKTRGFTVGHATQVTVKRVFFAFREVHGFYDFVRGGVVLFFLKIEGNDGGMSVLIVGHAGEIPVVFEDLFEIALYFRKAGVSDCDVLPIFVVSIDVGNESALELPKETDGGLGAVVSFGESVSGILKVKEVFDKRETKFLDAFASVGDGGLDSVQGENLSHERDVGLVDGFGKELFAGIVFSQRELVEKRSHSATFEEVKDKGFSLVPSKYIEFVNRDENIDYDTKMRALQEELTDLLKQEEQSKQDLLAVFKELGCD